jgi:hypothetical protein
LASHHNIFHRHIGEPVPLWSHAEGGIWDKEMEKKGYSKEMVKFVLDEKVVEFVMNLAKHITGIQIYVGEIEEIADIYKASNIEPSEKIISKEHPAYNYYPGVKDERDWMFPTVTGYHPSFFSYWKKCERLLNKL